MKKKNGQVTMKKVDKIPELDILDLENEDEFLSDDTPSEEESCEEDFIEDLSSDETFDENENAFSEEEASEESFSDDLSPDSDDDELEYLEPGEDKNDDSHSDADEKAPKKRFRINMHLVLLAAVLLFFGLIIFRVMNWGE